MAGSKATMWAASVPVDSPEQRLVLILLAVGAGSGCEVVVRLDKLAQAAMISRERAREILAQLCDLGLLDSVAGKPLMRAYADAPLGFYTLLLGNV